MGSDKCCAWEGQIVDVVAGRIFPGRVAVSGGRLRVDEHGAAAGPFILPGLIDAHVHIESSMLVPAEFARLAAPHGTVAAVSDPHEIANVMGVPGVLFMLANGARVPFKFFFGAPSCVPATIFETAGAELSAAEIAGLLARPDILYLAEMMNFPGVIGGAPDVMAKIEAARARGKVIDGHAPGLTGEALCKYALAGISTDHECSTLEEARAKIRCGMKILIREGSAAKNFEALIDLLGESPEMVMFCSDDKHPNDLVRGHINELVKRALLKGHAPMAVLRAATLNPVRHYGLNVGLLQTGDPADFIVVDNLTDFRVLAVYIDGQKTAENGVSLIERVVTDPVNNFNCSEIAPRALALSAQSKTVRALEVIDGELLTRQVLAAAKIEQGSVVSDAANDLLKLVVVSRYRPAPPAIGFVKNFGLQRGALASSVAHDSHNIIAVGCSDEEIARVINLLIKARGGIAAAGGGEEKVMPLAAAGLMSVDDGYAVAREYEELDAMAKKLGCGLAAPFMTLSFLALPVIPELKLTDLGLFDGNKFEFVKLFV